VAKRLEHLERAGFVVMQPRQSAVARRSGAASTADPSADRLLPLKASGMSCYSCGRENRVRTRGLPGGRDGFEPAISLAVLPSSVAHGRAACRRVLHMREDRSGRAKNSGSPCPISSCLALVCCTETAASGPAASRSWIAESQRSRQSRQERRPMPAAISCCRASSSPPLITMMAAPWESASRLESFATTLAANVEFADDLVERTLIGEEGRSGDGHGSTGRRDRRRVGVIVQSRKISSRHWPRRSQIEPTNSG
jgi:hypothetical protein